MTAVGTGGTISGFSETIKWRVGPGSGRLSVEPKDSPVTPNRAVAGRSRRVNDGGYFDQIYQAK